MIHSGFDDRLVMMLLY